MTRKDYKAYKGDKNILPTADEATLPKTRREGVKTKNNFGAMHVPYKVETGCGN